MLATVRNYDDLVAAIRARRDELEVTHETIDTVSGVASGYASKLLADPPIKRRGMISLSAVLGALGLMLVVVEDCRVHKQDSQPWRGINAAPHLPERS